MSKQIAFPTEHLLRLDFLLGDGQGFETLYPPDGDPISFEASVSGSFETCDRFLRLDYFASIPTIGVETLRALITYSETRECYRCWIFSVISEEPAHFEGHLEGDSLVLYSDPIPMPWGLQRLRSTFTPLREGGYSYVSERWEPEGWVPYCSVNFLPQVSVT